MITDRSALLTAQSEKIEETLWTSLRMFEEQKNLLNNMAHREVASTRKRSLVERTKDIQVHIERIRAMLLTPQSELRLGQSQPPGGRN
jgi:two-component system, chemotaxis family, protein-glutamate methylesterase/glutaminase